ncbi:PemB family protein [Streptomyces mirabilis]|uniref:hypothetical protein n=1 Tax=Streptomyces mirabilis TaxID=68239 RepID=UPI00369CD037
MFDRVKLQLINRPEGGAIVAPNTDYRKKYGLLIANSTVLDSGPANQHWLGRRWHNTADVWPQAVIRDTALPASIKTAEPWTDMTPDYPWQGARLKEYHNTGLGAGVIANRPQLTDAEAGDYTAAKYLVGTDGWNPIW